MAFMTLKSSGNYLRFLVPMWAVQIAIFPSFSHSMIHKFIRLHLWAFHISESGGFRHPEYFSCASIQTTVTKWTSIETCSQCKLSTQNTHKQLENHTNTNSKRSQRVTGATTAKHIVSFSAYDLITSWLHIQIYWGQSKWKKVLAF